MRREVLEQLLADRAARRAVVLITELATGAQSLAYPFEPHVHADADIARAARQAAARDRSTLCELGGRELFLRVYNPPLRLFLVGAVHVAQALCPMAQLAGFDVLVIDPRTAFATAERFPGVALCTDWPDAALDARALDHRAAVATLSHDPKLDEPALWAALHSPAFYIGALGSKKTQAARQARLRERGATEPELARIHGPIGLDIGAASAAEIAVAILAQIIARLRHAPEPGA